MNRFFIITISLISFSFLNAVSWQSSLENARESAVTDQAPLLIYIHSQDNSSLQFNMLLDSGRLDFLEKHFIFFKADASSSEGESIMSVYDPGFMPFFILEDHNSERKQLIEPVAIFPVHLFDALHEIYGYISSHFLSLNNYTSAYKTLRLLENLPEDYSADVLVSMKRIESNVRDRMTVREKNRNTKTAETYLAIAKESVESGNYAKARMYYERIIELTPGSETAADARKSLEDIAGN